MNYQARTLRPSLSETFQTLEGTESRILEIGCGNGRLLLEVARILPQAYVFGVGLSESEREGTLDQVAELYGLSPSPKIELLFLDLNESLLPFADNFFDLVVSQCSLRYIREKLALIETIYRKLAHEGKAYLHLQLFSISGGTRDYFSQERFAGILTYDEKTQCLFLLKDRDRRLEFGLELNPSASRYCAWDPGSENYETVGWMSAYE